MTIPTLPSATASTALPVGAWLGEFKITGILGEGGFGIVYSAHDSSLDRIVAVKEYFPSALLLRTDEGLVKVKSSEHSKTFAAGLASFLEEAKMLARFSHPGLVEVFRFWEANGTAYMAMRYYRGVTLRELLRMTPQTVTEQWLCETIDPILLALKELHNEKCYHRDIAPDNILVSPNGRSVLMDFGASRRIIGGMTQALTTVLKPGFAPIEQYSDDGSMPQGAWTDIYAIGGLLYNAMTGKIPAQAISRMMSDPLKPVSELARGHFSAQLTIVVMKCLAVFPADRYQNIDELRAALGWVTTPGLSTVAYARPASVRLAQEFPPPVMPQRALATERTQVLGTNPVRKEIIDGLGSSVLEPEFGPMAPNVTNAVGPKIQGLEGASPGAEPGPWTTLITEAEAADRDDVKAATPAPAPVELSGRSKTLWRAGFAVIAIILVGVLVFIYGKSSKRDGPITASTPPATGTTVHALSPVAQVAESRDPSSSVGENPAPSAADNSSRTPAAAAVFSINSLPDSAARHPSGALATPQVAAKAVPAQTVTTGNVRVELKDGWATVFVDGENKGTAPPVITVKLSPGIHMVELRNPALPAVTLSVEVIAGKTAVVRHSFPK